MTNLVITREAAENLFWGYAKHNLIKPAECDIRTKECQDATFEQWCIDNGFTIQEENEGEQNNV